MIQSPLVCILFTAAIAQAGTPIHWLHPIDGDWNSKDSWDGGRIPGQAGDEPTLGLSGPYTVYSNSNVSYESLRISNPEATLQITNSNHSFSKEIVNEGLIVLGDPDFLGHSVLSFGGFNTIGGSGAIQLNSPDTLHPSRVEALFSIFTHEVEHMIHGSGEIEVISMTNNGTIRASQSPGLVLSGRYVQSKTGTIESQGGTVFLGEDVEVIGGVLASNPDGQVIVQGASAHLENLTNRSNLGTSSGPHELILGGNILNLGNIRIDSSNDHEIRTLLFSDGSSISGAGTVELITDGDVSKAVIDIEPGGTTSIGAGQLIKTSGLIRGPIGTSILHDGVITSIPGLTSPMIRTALTGTGKLIAQETDIYLRYPAALSGITLDSVNNGGYVIGLSTTQIQNCVINAPIRFDASLAILEIRQNIVNNGHISIDAQSTPGNIRMNSVGGASLTGTGSVELISRDGEWAWISAISNELTIGPDQEIFGHGRITSDFLNGVVVNQGVIRAVSSSYPLVLSGRHRGDGGRYIAANADIFLDSPVEIESAIFESEGIGEVLASQSRLISCINDGGVIRFESSSSDPIIEGDMVNHGQMIVESTTMLSLASVSTLSGTGELILNPGSELRLGTFTNLADPVLFGEHTIRGAGRIRGSGIIQSDIIADHPDHGIDIRGDFDFVESQLISDGATFFIGSSTTVRGARMVGDHFEAAAEVVFDNIMNESQLDVVGSAILVNGSTNAGTVRVRSSPLSSEYSVLNIGAESPILGTGVIEIENQIGHRHDSAQIRSAVNQRSRIGAGQRVIGGGQIFGHIVIEGELSPSGPRPEFQVNKLELTKSSTLVSRLRGLSEHRPSVSMLPSGSVEVHGGLRIEIDFGFNPQAGAVWEIIGSTTSKVPGTIMGQFTTIELPEPPTGFRYIVDQNDHSVFMSVVCVADFDGDAELDANDISLFLEYLLIGDPLSDLTGDGEFDYFDVAEFIQAFSVGCGL